MEREDSSLAWIHRDSDPVYVRIPKGLDPREVLHQGTVITVEWLIDPEDVGVAHRKDDGASKRRGMLYESRIQGLKPGPGVQALLTQPTHEPRPARNTSGSCPNRS